MGGAVARDGECEKWRKEAAIAQEECDRLKKACGAKEQESAAASEEHAQESEMLKEQASTRLEQVSAMLVQCTQLENEVAEKMQEAAEAALRSAEQEARVKEAEALNTEVESAVAEVHVAALVRQAVQPTVSWANLPAPHAMHPPAARVASVVAVTKAVLVPAGQANAAVVGSMPVAQTEATGMTHAVHVAVSSE